MHNGLENRLVWNLGITPNEMFSLYHYPIEGKSSVSLCEEHA